MGTSSLYLQETLFGLDIGHNSLKVMQLEAASGGFTVKGYGLIGYSEKATAGGVIVKPNLLSEAIHKLFAGGLVGEITTSQVALTLPTAHTYSRPMKVPLMEADGLSEAVHLEAEQYIPLPVNSLYVDWEISNRNPDSLELLMVAVPKNIVDSYMVLLDMLELEPTSIEPAVNADARVLRLTNPPSAASTILIDFGSVTTDVAVIDRAISVNSTVSFGSSHITDLIAKNLKMSPAEADKLKYTHGLSASDKQTEIFSAIRPILDAVVAEVRKIIRYYHEHSGKGGQKISQILTCGGGAAMPGLNQLIGRELDLPTQLLNPWPMIDFGQLPKPPTAQFPAYITVTGEACLTKAEIDND
ncbi:MAG: type IV pilus assembly protein PilM [Candidatus Saccharimonadales bacterium]